MDHSKSDIALADKKHFKKSHKAITRVGLGGEGVLRTTGRHNDAEAVIKEAVNQGISYFDSARVYMDSERYYGRFWKDHPNEREKIFHTSKSADRSREGALAELSQTLQRLNTPYLDLWQIHDVRTQEDLDRISEKGGALEAFIEAREMGLVRQIGVTGHHDPVILTQAVEQWPVDTVLMPVNPVEASIGGFLTHTLEAARKKEMAVIGMKVLGGKHYIAPELGVTAGLLVRFALSFDISVAIVGCSTPDEVKTLADAGRHPAPLTADEQNRIVALYRPMAERLAFYRGSVFNKP